MVSAAQQSTTQWSGRRTEIITSFVSLLFVFCIVCLHGVEQVSRQYVKRDGMQRRGTGAADDAERLGCYQHDTERLRRSGTALSTASDRSSQWSVFAAY